MAILTMLDAFSGNWQALLLRGILAVLFGIAALAMPGLTLVTLVLLYGVYVLADGIMAAWVGAKARAWWLLLAGVLGVLVGVYTFFYPGITAVALLYLIAGLAVIRGIFEIATAIRLRKEMTGEWALILAGVVSILFGVFLFARPAAGALAMVWLIGVWALVFGLIMIILALRVRGFRGRLARA
jgi:uncharacterized membrane protein HdeD (DUF308 family)